MVWLFWILFAAGYAWWGRPFVSLAWSTVVHGLPKILRDELESNRFVRTVMMGVMSAVLLWVCGMSLGFALTRGEDATVGQTFMLVSTVVSSWIVLLARFLGGTTLAILIPLSPLPQRTKTRLTRIRKGIGAYVLLGVSFQLFVTLGMLLVGAYTQTWVVVVFLFVLFGYLVTSKAYNLEITWLPGLKINTQVTIMFGVLGLVGLCIIPYTRTRIVAALGLSPGNFVNRSVVDTTALDGANKAQRVSRREICNAQLDAVRKALKEIRPTVESTDSAGKKVIVPNPTALRDHNTYTQQLRDLEKICL